MDWLIKVCEDAHMRVMLDHSPSKYISIASPVSDREAAELYFLMAQRFEAWTGKPLAGFIDQQQGKVDG